jgi:hypothetical protein
MDFLNNNTYNAKLENYNTIACIAIVANFTTQLGSFSTIANGTSPD